MRYNLKISLLLAAILAIATGYPQQESRPGCLITPDEMRAYTDEVRMQTDALKQADKLHFYPVERLDADSISIEKFLDLNYLGWPLRNANYSDFPGWAIGNFVDLDYYSDGDEDYFEDSETEDYECGHRTYDGHQGIDIGIHPYHWKAQDDGAVEVVAAASGVIVDKREGYYDEYCVWGGAANSRGNSIVILLDDTSTATFYMHMKDGRSHQKWKVIMCKKESIWVQLQALGTPPVLTCISRSTTYMKMIRTAILPDIIRMPWWVRVMMEVILQLSKNNLRMMTRQY